MGISNEHSKELRNYFKGYIIALIMTLAAFGVGISEHISRQTALIIIGVLGVSQLLVHIHYFLHVDFSERKREDLNLILFSALLLSIMVAGTIWLLVNLYNRMM